MAMVLTLFLTLGSVSLGAENWPQWRGPTLNGASAKTGLPLRWSKTEIGDWRHRFKVHG